MSRRDLASLTITLHPAREAVRPALGLALVHGMTVYNACYLAVAAAVGARVVTLDERLVADGGRAGLPVVSASALASR